MSAISKKTFDFLKAIKKNNSRDWFEQNKDQYTASHEDMIDFAEDLMADFSKHDNLVPMTGKKSLFRIYRDVRFSKNKAPYKSHWSGSMKRDTPWLRGGYYYHVEPGNSMIACGFWGPEKDDLRLIRDNLALDADPLRKIIASKKFTEAWGSLEGEQLKTAPKGFPKDHPNIDLLRYKQFVVSKRFTDKEVMQEDFKNVIIDSFRAIRPFLDYMSEILTHDLNGEPLYK